MQSTATTIPASTAPQAPLFTKAHTFVYRLTGGRLGGHVGRMQILLLTTTGRKSGRRYAVPLSYFHAGDILFLVASNGGHDRHPAWYFNIVANPQIEVELNGKRYTATATIASPEERARIWPDFSKANANYAAYQRRTSRQIPIVLLHGTA